MKQYTIQYTRTITSAPEYATVFSESKTAAQTRFFGLHPECFITKTVEEEVIDEKEELLDRIQNLMGFFDTPIAKRKLASVDYEEVRDVARDVLKKYGRVHR